MQGFPRALLVVLPASSIGAPFRSVAAGLVVLPVSTRPAFTGSQAKETETMTPHRYRLHASVALALALLCGTAAQAGQTNVAAAAKLWIALDMECRDILDEGAGYRICRERDLLAQAVPGAADLGRKLIHDVEEH
jgi:hypothetical protein